MGARTAVLCSFLLTAAACGDEFGPEPGGPDQAPVFDDVAFTTDEDTPLTQTLAASDPDGDPVEIAISDPVNGTLERNGPSITYTPNANWYGTERLTVTVTAGGRSTAGRVTIIVEPVNDAPVATDDTLAGLSEDTVQIVLPVTVLANDTDIDGDALTVSAVGSATGGTVSLSGSAIAFTPAANFSGNATFEYTVSDGAATDTGTVTLQITGDSDPPVAGDDVTMTPEDVALVTTVAALVGNDVDPDGQTLAITSVGNAVNGAVVQTGADITFTPAPDFFGEASFQYQVTDGAATDVGTVVVMVTAVNDAPVAVDDTATTVEDTALVLAAAALLANDTDVDDDPLTITAVGEATNGTVALDGTTITFTPTAGFSGAALFTYTVSDGTDTDTGTVAVTVTSDNAAPVAVDDTATTDEDTALTVAKTTLLANDTDADGDPLDIVSVGTAVNGTVAIVGDDVVFTPAASFAGAGTFEYLVSDGEGGTDVGLVTVTVTNVDDDAPVALPDELATDEDVPLTFPASALIGNDVELDGQALRLASVTLVDPADGTLETVVDGDDFITFVTFTPAANLNGAVALTYTVTDTTTAPVTGAATIAVAAVNDPPVANDDVYPGTPFVGEALTVAISGLLANDSDVDGDDLTLTIDPSSAVGLTVVDNGDGTFTFTATQAGVVSFEYELSDGQGGTDRATASATAVEPVCGNDALEFGEECDDGNTEAGDGCTAECVEEFCGDGIRNDGENEACDDGDADDLDGCTSQCELAPVCDTTVFPDADRFAINSNNNHCYASIDDDQVTFDVAQAACAAAGGYLVTITDAEEDAFVAASVLNTAQNPWIGADEDGNDTDDVFVWVTGESWGYTNFAAGEPNDDAGFGDMGDCLHIANAAGEWADTNCDFDQFVTGYLCETGCGNGALEMGEECDDGNNVPGDGCDSVCVLEPARLVINEVDYDQAGTDANSFIEIVNAGGEPATLADYAVILVNGNGNDQYARFNLSAAGATLEPGAYLIIANASVVAPNGTFRIDVTGDLIQNGGPDAVALFEIATSTLVDALAYESSGSMITDVTDFGSGIELVAGDAFTGADTNDNLNSLCRLPDGSDTGDDATDWALCTAITPGAANVVVNP